MRQDTSLVAVSMVAAPLAAVAAYACEAESARPEREHGGGSAGGPASRVAWVAGAGGDLASAMPANGDPWDGVPALALHVEGHQLRDAGGRNVVLRG